jgi:hypothetical protein
MYKRHLVESLGPTRFGCWVFVTRRSRVRSADHNLRGFGRDSGLSEFRSQQLDLADGVEAGQRWIRRGRGFWSAERTLRG